MRDIFFYHHHFIKKTMASYYYYPTKMLNGRVHSYVMYGSNRVGNNLIICDIRYIEHEVKYLLLLCHFTAD